MKLRNDYFNYSVLNTQTQEFNLENSNISNSSFLVAVVLNWDADIPYHVRVYTPREWTFIC